MEFEFKEIRVGDISLAYIEQGRGLPIVFVHGSGPTDSRTWGSQIEPFAAHFRVIAYSQRCHYPNVWIGDGSDVNLTSVQANDLAGLIMTLQLGRVHLIGSSYGAEIVLRLAVEHPELVRTLVVAEPGLATWLVTFPGGAKLFAEYTSTMIPAKQAVQKGELELGARLFIDAVLGKGYFDHLPIATKSRILDNARLIGVEPTDIEEIITDITRNDTAMIQAPTLVLTGDESQQWFLLVSQELARTLPNAEQVEIGGASHLLHSMNPQDFNASVLAFLAKHAD